MHPRPWPADREPFTGLYRITAGDDQTWFTTSRETADQMANEFERLMPYDSWVRVDRLSIETPRYIQPALPFILARRKRWAGAKTQVIEKIRSSPGRNEEFTPKEKQYAFRHLQRNIPMEEWFNITPLIDNAFIERAEGMKRTYRRKGGDDELASGGFGAESIDRDVEDKEALPDI